MNNSKEKDKEGKSKRNKRKNREKYIQGMEIKKEEEMRENFVLEGKFWLESGKYWAQRGTERVI